MKKTRGQKSRDTVPLIKGLLFFDVVKDTIPEELQSGKALFLKQ
jgi:hypothetical protein